MGAEVSGVQALLCASGYLLGMAPLLARRDWSRDERVRRLRRYCLTYGPLFGLPVALALFSSVQRHEPLTPGAWLAAAALVGPLALLRSRAGRLTR